MIAIVLIFALAYILIGLYGGYLCNIVNSHRLHSFASGILISGLFYIFIGEIFLTQNHLLTFIMILTFTILLGLKLQVKEHHAAYNKVRLTTEVIHYLIVGNLFGLLATKPWQTTLLIGIPLLFVKASGAYERGRQKISTQSILLYSLVIVGFILSTVIGFPEIAFEVSLAIVAGSLFYRIITLILAKMCIRIDFMIYGEVFYVLLFLARTLM